MLHIFKNAELSQGISECLDGYLVLVRDSQFEQLVWNCSDVS